VVFDAGKTSMIELPYDKKNYDDMLSRFHLIPERNGRTDRQTDRFAISILRVSICAIKTRMASLPDGEKHFEDIFIRFDKIYERDRHRD